MKQIRIVVLFIFTTFILTGCISKDTKQLISQYAKSSNISQENIQETYKNILDNHRKAKYYKAVRDGAIIKDLHAIQFDYSGQMRTLSDLVSFSQAIVMLTDDTFNNKIDESSINLYNSVKSLSDNSLVPNNVKKEDLQLFAVLINGAFRSYSEYVRTKKLKELILLSDKWVQPSIDGLDKDLEQWKKILKRSLNEQKNIQIMILNQPYTYCQVEDKSKKCVLLSETFETKSEMYKDVAMTQERLDNLDEEFDVLSKSIKIMSKLHKSVIESLKHDKIDKDGLFKIFHELKEQADSINKFRKNL